jgi:sRNA-binding protein
MPTREIEAALRRLVTEGVRDALEPYKKVLKGLAASLDRASRRTPGRQPKAVRSRSLPRRHPRSALKAADALKVGQAVRYRQGRGSFEATIIDIDEATGLVRLERAKDGKKVERPSHKLYQAPPAAEVIETVVKAPRTAMRGRKAARRALRLGKRARAAAAPANLKEGTTVLYRQGRGTFQACVVAIEATTGTVLLRRETDGKEVLRPYRKVQAVEGAA